MPFRRDTAAWLGVFEQASADDEFMQLGADRCLAGERCGVPAVQRFPAQALCQCQRARPLSPAGDGFGLGRVPQAPGFTPRVASVVVTVCRRASSTDNSPARCCWVMATASPLAGAAVPGGCGLRTFAAHPAPPCRCSPQPASPRCGGEANLPPGGSARQRRRRACPRVADRAPWQSSVGSSSAGGCLMTGCLRPDA
jgi:hypothetical protein